MKIAIINDVHIGKPLERNNAMRAASHLAAESLPKLLSHIETQHAPDILINLGDLIRSEHKEIDQKNYTHAITHFKQVKCPVLHLFGNHELKRMSAKDIEDIWGQSGFHQKSYGLKKFKGIALIWLGLEYNPANYFKHTLPNEQLNWLRDTLQELNLPVIIFTHCAVDNHDVKGNYFYEGYTAKETSGFFLHNYEEIQQAISECPLVEIVVQGHLHYFHSNIFENVPYVTCPAMGDNICGPNVSHHIPEIYSLLTFSENRLTLKAFSREYSFAGFEFIRAPHRS